MVSRSGCLLTIFFVLLLNILIYKYFSHIFNLAMIYLAAVFLVGVTICYLARFLYDDDSLAVAKIQVISNYLSIALVVMLLLNMFNYYLNRVILLGNFA